MKRYISLKNFPPRPPLTASFVYYLVLCHFNAPEWLWTTVIIIFILFWIVYFIYVFSEKEDVDIFENDSKK